jgi:hypothetical protein
MVLFFSMKRKPDSQDRNLSSLVTATLTSELDYEKELEKINQEDSEGDMLMTSDDENEILFPPELGDAEED